MGMTVHDLLYLTVGVKPNTMLIGDKTIIEIKSVNGCFNSCIYGHWYEDKILEQEEAIIKSFMFDVQNNKVYIELEGGITR